MLLGLLVPGLGHAWVGRRARGALGPLPARRCGGRRPAAAPRAVVAPRPVAEAAGVGLGDPGSPSFEVATTYLIVAGVLNVLLAFDAWDVAGGRKP